MEDRQMKLEGEFDRNQIIGFLEDLVSGLRNGRVFLQQEADSLILSPGEALKLSLHAQHDSKMETFRIEMAWDKAMEALA